MDQVRWLESRRKSEAMETSRPNSVGMDDLRRLDSRLKLETMEPS